MTDEPRRLVQVGSFPTSGAEIFIGGVDPVAIMVREANARLDAERAEAERARLSASADAERTKARMRGTRTARAASRLRRALRAFARLK